MAIIPVRNGGWHLLLNSEPIPRPKLYEEIVSRIEAAILAGDIKAGDTLPSEREIMQLYGVGRTAVREALFALQKKGIVHLQSGQRATVVEPKLEVILESLSDTGRHLVASPEQLSELHNARCMLEAFLARVAAQQATPAQIAGLEVLLEQNRATIQDPERFIDTNLAFHRAIALVSGNVFIEGLYRTVHSWLATQRRVASQDPGACEDAYHWHVRIFEAIRNRDADEAEQVMSRHIEQAGAAYSRAITRQAPQQG